MNKECCLEAAGASRSCSLCNSLQQRKQHLLQQEKHKVGQTQYEGHKSLLYNYDMQLRAVCRNFSKGGGGGANLGYEQKRGRGGSLCGVLHPTLARGRARMAQGGENAPPCPLKYSPATESLQQRKQHLLQQEKHNMQQYEGFTSLF